MDSDQKLNNQIRVAINKKETLLQNNTTIIELLEQRNERNRSAVWLNGRQLYLMEYPLMKIREGADIKILRVVAGG